VKLTASPGPPMTFRETKLKGVFEIGIEPRCDDRGFFARSWCRSEFEKHGLNTQIVQCNISYNSRKSTLRGMHYQLAPKTEAKLVRCTRGSIFDVALDLRPGSATFLEWTAAVLTAAGHEMLHIPEGCGHGFLTLENDTEVLYQMSEFYSPESSRGVRWNDPAFGIRWPAEVSVISDRDRQYPNFVRP